MANYLGYPFDPELFLYNWKNEPDMTKTAMIDSGAVQNNAEIENLIANGSDFYTVPFYKTIGGTPDNYDGAANITVSEPASSSQNGIVYGRAHAWKERDFVVDYNSGADPMSQITSQVAKYWNKQRQATLIGILNACFGVTGSGDFAAWENHKTDISAASGTVTDANKFGATTAGDAIQKAVGDAADQFTLAVMHSKVANGLAGLQLLNFWKYTDAQGIERRLNIADFNGLTVIVDDGMPVSGSGATAKYTTYLLGNGAIQYAEASVKNPTGLVREELANGGYTALVTRLRETLLPNGFSFTKPDNYTASPTYAQLADSANWSVVGDPKSIAMAQVVSNA